MQTIENTKIMTLDSARELLEQSPLKADRIKANVISLDRQGMAYSFKVGDNTFEIGESANKDISSVLGISLKSLKEYQDDSSLLRTCIQHSLTKRRNKEITVVTSGKRLQNIFEGHRSWIDPRKVFDSCANVLGNRCIGVDGRYGIRNENGESGFRFITEQQFHPENDVNDITHAGISISLNGNVTISAFAYRLACTNGMLSKDVISSYSLVMDESTEFVKRLHSTLDSAYEMTNSFMSLATVRETNPAGFLAGLAHSTKLPNNRARQLLETVEELPVNPSRYDIVNHITSRGVKHNDRRFEYLGSEAVGMYTDNYRWQRVKC